MSIPRSAFGADHNDDRIFFPGLWEKMTRPDDYPIVGFEDRYYSLVLAYHLSSRKISMNILVTGGSGFIGGHMVDRLVREGHTVLNLDAKPPSNGLHPDFWHQVDILDEEKLTSEVREFSPEVVIHLAARAEISSTSWEDFASIHRGTSNLLDALDNTPSIKRLLNISTQLVVGPGHYPEHNQDYNPYTTYGEAKAHAEKEIRSRDPGYVWCHIRPTNVWGPNHPSFAGSIWKYLHKRYYLHPQTSEPVMRSYGYVTNAVSQIHALMEADADKINGDVFYLADGCIDSALWLDEFSNQMNGKPTRRLPFGLLKVFATIGDGLKALKLPTPLESGRLMRMTTDYPVPLDNTFAICGQPQVSLEDAVAETWSWMKTQHSQ